MFKPKFMICEKKYGKELAAKIKKDLPSNQYVIKPLKEFKGRGVVIVNQENLDAMLYKLLHDYGVLHRGEKEIEKNESEGHWKRDKGNFFLVEEYCPSKPLTINKKVYDATMRVVFMMRHNQSSIDIHYLDAYWKVPHHATTDQVDLTMKLKSFGYNPTKASKQEKRDVFAIFDRMLPKLYHKMFHAVNTHTLPTSVIAIPMYTSHVHPNAYNKKSCRQPGEQSNIEKLKAIWLASKK